jgi:fibronectin type 3 domain-containing protein
MASGNTFVNDSNLKSDGWARLVTTSSGTFTPQWNQSPAGTFASSTASFKANGSVGAYGACDLNQDSAVNVIDVQLATNMNLGLRACTANIAGSGVCTPLVIQQVTNAALGSPCVVASSHSVLLSWAASTTPGVNYNVYRSNTSGGPYTKLTTTTPVSGLSYIDGTVNGGQTYYYVTTAINSSGESAYSNEAPAAVPFP